MAARFDVSILGSGPAALAAVVACVRVGLRVACVAPDHDAPWPQTYGTWIEDLEGSAFDLSFSEVWSRPLVRTGAARLHVLDALYARIDNEAVRASLWSEAGEVRLFRGRAIAVDGGVVETDRGERVEAAVVVDATGHGSRFVRADGPPASAFQVAWGFVAEVGRHPWSAGEMLLMDVTADHLLAGDRAPSFLYALPLSDGRVLLEETSLASRPPLGLRALRDRLERRLRGLGIELRIIHHTERVQFAMDPPMPVIPQPVVAFGAAASFVHPATGYSVARAFSAAPALARALSSGLSEGGSPDGAAAQAWSAIWPRRARRARALQRFGLEVLLARTPHETCDFFDAFFSLPRHHWRAYLASDAHPGEVAAAMLALFARSDLRLRGTLLRAGLVDRGLWRALTPFAEV